jgi:hypothetical protein
MAKSQSSGRRSKLKVSFHKHTGRYYVKRRGRRIYLGRDHDEALTFYVNNRECIDQGRRPDEIAPPPIRLTGCAAAARPPLNRFRPQPPATAEVTRARVSHYRA